MTLTGNAVLSKNYSGSVIELDSADGVAVTLPEATRGLEYHFVVKTSVTASDVYEILTQTSDKIRGVLVAAINDTASKSFAADGTTDKISMNGSTTGGLLGGYFTLVSDLDGVWTVRGINVSSGSVATPFA